MMKLPNNSRLLLVEDDVDLSRELSDFLTSNGINIRTCKSASEAIARIDSDPFISVVVTDIALGELSGLELLRKIRRSRHADRIQAIVVSGYTSVDNLLAAIRLGAADFLPKPVGVEELLEAVRSALARSTALQDMEKKVSSSKVLLEVRRKRDALFGVDLFEDPAWNMLLDLHESTLRGTPVSVTDLCVSAGTSATTALRRLSVLEQLGFVERVPDARDRRRVFVCQTKRGAERMQAFSQWFESFVYSQ